MEDILDFDFDFGVNDCSWFWSVNYQARGNCKRFDTCPFALASGCAELGTVFIDYVKYCLDVLST